MILAGGENKRWLGDGPKEVAPINGEPVVARAVRMCLERNITPTVISHKPEVQRVVAPLACYLEQSLYLLDVAWHLRSRWAKRTVILFGDVVYTDAALSAVLSCKEMLWWFGHNHEMFGHVWRPSRVSDQRILDVIKQAYAEARRRFEVAV